jgi:hypothetical protein
MVRSLNKSMAKVLVKQNEGFRLQLARAIETRVFCKIDSKGIYCIC